VTHQQELMMDRTKIDYEADPFLLERRQQLTHTTIEYAKRILWEARQNVYANAAYKLSMVQERLLMFQLFFNNQTLSRKHERYSIFTDDWSRTCLAERLTIDQVVEYVIALRPTILSNDSIEVAFG
jgi:hypothetical protein